MMPLDATAKPSCSHPVLRELVSSGRIEDGCIIASAVFWKAQMIGKTVGLKMVGF
jgi:hypothetical protein